MPGDETALRYVLPAPSDALSLLSLLLPGNVVVADDVPISPAHLDTQEQQHQPRRLGRAHESCRMQMNLCVCLSGYVCHVVYVCKFVCMHVRKDLCMYVGICM